MEQGHKDKLMKIWAAAENTFYRHWLRPVITATVNITQQTFGRLSRLSYVWSHNRLWCSETATSWGLDWSYSATRVTARWWYTNMTDCVASTSRGRSLTSASWSGVNGWCCTLIAAGWRAGSTDNKWRRSLLRWTQTSWRSLSENVTFQQANLSTAHSTTHNTATEITAWLVVSKIYRKSNCWSYEMTK